jgi:hypothetical protein
VPITTNIVSSNPTHGEVYSKPMLVVHASTLNKTYLFIITILSEHFQTPTEKSEKETKLISLTKNTWPLTFRVLIQALQEKLARLN